MENLASISSPSLRQFEDFITEYPTAENIVISDGHIVASSSAKDQDQVAIKEALKKALKEKYPEQEELANLVDQASGELKSSGKSWDAHTIRQVIEQVEEDATWKEVEDKGISQEDIENVARAFDEYAQEVLGSLSPEERESLQQQFAGTGLVAGAGVGIALLATHIPTHPANIALANLLANMSASLTHVGTNLPMEGLAAPAQHLAVAASLPTTHLASAAAMLGATTTASVQVTVTSAASAIVPFIVAGAIAHRLYIAASRIAQTSSSVEHEVNNITTAMIATALATIPPAQHGLLLSTIVAGIVGQHTVDPGLLQQAFHNIRDAALGVYLVHHPEVAILLGEELKTLLCSAFKAVAPAIGLSATNANTTAAATNAVTATTTAGTVTQTVPAGVAHHSMTATAAHGLSATTSVIAATIAAHPGVAAAILVGGACTVAYQCLKSTPSPESQN